MGTLTELLVEERIRDIEREATSRRVPSFEDVASTAGPAWRRASGGAARRLSVALAELAADLDPSLRRRSYGSE